MSLEDFYELEIEFTPETSSKVTGSSGNGGAMGSSVKDSVRLIDTDGVNSLADVPKYFLARTNSEFVNIDAAIILYSLTDASTFQLATNLFNDLKIKKDSKTAFPVMVLGNRLDLINGTGLDQKHQRHVSQNDISQWVQTCKVPLHFEVSLYDRDFLVSCFSQLISKFHVTAKSGFALPGFRKK